MSVTSNPTVSVVVPTYNRADLLQRAIDSILNQTYSDFELIIVDDASTDNTQAVVDEYDDPRIKYVEKEQNEGGAAARNTGIQHSCGDFVAFCDSDDEWIETKLEKQTEVIKTHECTAVYCRHYVVEDEYDAFRRSSGELRSGDIRADLLQGWCPASTSFFLVEKESLRAVDGFDPQLPSFQDYDLWLRLAQDHTFCYVDEHLVIKHNHHGEQLATSPEKRSEGLKYFLEKWEKEIQSKYDKETVDRIRDKHLKQIYFNTSLNSRIEKDFRQSLIYGYKYLAKTFNNPNPKNIGQLLVVLFTGKVGDELLQSAYYELSWQQMPINHSK
jgi:glycosyltransferase involved in cell wall biosynthesis